MSPEARARLAPVIRKFMKSPHPFRACVRALTGEPGITNPEGVCGVLKKLGKQGAGAVREEDLEQVFADLEEAGLTEATVPVLEMYLLVEAAQDPDDPAVLEGEVAEAGPLIEASSRIIVPKRGKVFADDGTCKVAIIRPCVSSGRRLRGLPPIYSPRMLAECAAVFTDWHMFMDHLSEEMVEALRRRQRSIRELGGRVTKSWWDPDLRTAEDDERGFKPGGVLGRALPQPAIRSMLEADPELLRVSINAWPTSAREGEMWGQKGMMIEGIRARPRGSVDWVLRDGAGGRPLAEDEQLAVSLLERYYDASQGDHVTQKAIKDMTAAELREHLRTANAAAYGQLEEAIRTGGEPPATPPAPPPAPTVKVTEGAPLTAEAVQALLETQATTLTTSFDAKLKEHDGQVEQRAQKLVEERETARTYQDRARALIEGAKGLKPSFREQLLAKYAVGTASEPVPAALLAEAEKDGETVKKTPLQVFEGRVKADIERSLAMIREAAGLPAVTGQGSGKVTEGNNGGAGAGNGSGNGEPKGPRRKGSVFRDFMLEGGGFKDVDGIDQVFEEVSA